MKRMITTVACFAVLAAAPLYAADQTTGRDLLHECTSFALLYSGKNSTPTAEDIQAASQCTSFLDGVQQMHNALAATGKPLYCLSPDVTLLEMDLVVFTYLAGHQQELNDAGAILAIKAWKEKWPCPKK